jgi:plastocyanin
METKTMAIEDVYKHTLKYLYNIAPNETTALDFTFDHTAPPGMLEFSCRYSGHYEAGMHQAIVVNAAAGASVSPYPHNAIPLSVVSHQGTHTGSCDPAITTQIGNDAYTPASISLNRGDTLTIINTGSQSYTPTVAPSGGIRRTSGGPNNITYITFLRTGSFTLSSQEHPEAKATISVSSTVGATCEMTPVAAVSFDANYTDPKNPYILTPTQVRIKKGQSIRLNNAIDQNLTFISTPDAGLGEVSIFKNWDQDLKFTAEGTYTISCVQFPNQKFTVTVQGT